MSGRCMFYCYFIFETSKQDQDIAEDTKLQVFHPFQEAWPVLLTLFSDFDYPPPQSFLYIDRLLPLRAARH